MVLHEGVRSVNDTFDFSSWVLSHFRYMLRRFLSDAGIAQLHSVNLLFQGWRSLAALVYVFLPAALKGGPLHRLNSATVGITVGTLTCLAGGGFILESIISLMVAAEVLEHSTQPLPLAPILYSRTGTGGREPAALAWLHRMIPLGNPRLLLPGSFLSVLCC